MSRIDKALNIYIKYYPSLKGYNLKISAATHSKSFEG